MVSNIRCFRGGSSSLVVVVVVAVVVLGVLPVTVSAKKDLPTFKVLTAAIPHIQCDVCKAAVMMAHQQTEELRNPTPSNDDDDEVGDENKKKKKTKSGKLQEEDVVSEVLEKLCNPRSTPGQWIRKIDIEVVRTEKDKETPGLEVALRAYKEFGNCRTECMTIAEVCNSILDDPDADDFSSLLFKGKSVAKIESEICSPYCKPSKLKAAHRKFPVTVETADMFDVEALEVVDSKEMEVEAMMDDMQKKRGSGGAPSYDVFSRDEMKGLQAAMRDGDYEAFKQFDPKGEELSEDDFHMLRQMQKQQEGGGGGGADFDELSREFETDTGKEEEGVPAERGGSSWWASFKALMGL